ncbi:MAG: hypothetical protein US42_C0016G0022 [Candidatus Magasanikbacteria bacterium GW2011_GWC2_37_14]|uniref:Uncharacterized protein n=1 Tax=Candidatus Magasanikbacteria bacterium GW2011_GWC2_37_14 TaxID=1619046 RepID=A0A0G0GAM2_9BACT|nr:MAG: hypothetical protein US42_C0016G0022 [Candidatus Magasanikbacteria bacterium GW2011_GWC2_37_14]
MAQEPQLGQLDYLTVFINKILDEAGMETMAEELRDEFVPKFVAEAYTRLGLALFPLLNKEQLEAYGKLMERDDVEDSMVFDFWKTSLPNFEQLVQTTLNQFATELKNNLQK